MLSKEIPAEKIDDIIELYSSGQIQKALKSINSLSIIYPEEPILHNIRGACYSSLNQKDKAIKSFKDAVFIKPDYIDGLYNLGNTYRELNQLNDAIICFRDIINIDPVHLEAQYNLGLTLYQLDLLYESLEHFENAILIFPENIEIRINIGNILLDLNKNDEAIEHYNKVLTQDPNNSKVYNNLGTIFREIGQSNFAIDHFKKAIELDSEYSEAFYNLGFSYQDLGQSHHAIKNYEKAINIDNHAKSFHSLSYIKNYKLNDPHLSQIKTILSSNQLSQHDRIQINFGLANVYEKFDVQTEYFNYLNEGNRLQKIQSNYLHEESALRFKSIKKLFNSPLNSVKKSHLFASLVKKPIFIVGMPRSGTSLVEQILASHKEVYGAGELNTLHKLANPIINNHLSGDISSLNEQTICFVRDTYIDFLKNLDTQNNIITEKLPLNFQYIGLILSAIPEAKIVHLKRDARATCWSNYKYYFESKDNGYSNNFKDLADFYKLYVDLMNYWHQQFPNKIFDLSYEDLTINQEDETRGLLDYCELDWDDNCLKFNDNDRPVKTISALQVRKKMYQGSSEAWKKHWSQIQPLIAALKEY